MNQDNLILFVFKAHKNSVKMLVLQREDNYDLPVLKDHDPQSNIEQTIKKITHELHIQPIISGMTFTTEGELISLPLFIDSMNKLAEDTRSAVDWYGVSTKIVWVHPRRVHIIIKERLIKNLYDKTLEWLIDHDFAVGVLVNNLELLR